MAHRGWHLSALLCLITGAKADDFWNNFANNLATDLAPLIQLFGEAVTKQYLSESLDIWDNIIFACAPLGILTAVVSAIRVCGSPSLKAFIGRAQESTGVAELELLSSTSKSTAELWHEGGITRVFGQPQVSEFVYAGNESSREPKTNLDKRKTDVTSGIGVQRLDDVLTELRTASLVRKTSPDARWTSSFYVRPRFATIPSEKDVKPPSDDDEIYRLYGWRYVGSNKDPFSTGVSHESGSPNLSLNLGIKRLYRGYFYAAAMFGLILQIGVLAFAAVTVFVRPDLFPVESPVHYGFPCLIAGTVLLCCGMLGCAYIIEAATIEDYFINDGNAPVWLLQMGGQKVGDQVFRPFAAPHVSNVYIRSMQKLRGEPDELRLWVAVVITVAGFVLQFVALRAVHASVTLFQLGSTLVMSIVRASLRSSRLKPSTYRLQSSDEEFHEFDQIAHKLVAGERDLCILVQPSTDTKATTTDLTTDTETGAQNGSAAMALKESSTNGDDSLAASDSFISKITELVKVRAQLGWLHEEKYGKQSQPLSSQFADRLQRAIEDSADILMPYVVDPPSADEEGFTFKMKISTPWDSQNSFEWGFALRGETGSWKLKAPEDLDAILGLWSWTVETKRLGYTLRAVVDDSTIAMGFDYKAYQAWVQRRMEPLLRPNDYLNANTGTTAAGFPAKQDSVDAVIISLEQQPSLTCAQDLYMLFLEEVLKHIPKLVGQLTLRGTTLYIRNQTVMKLQHNKVEKLADIVENTLLGSREDAYMLIIPAMIRQSKIPPLNEAYRVVMKQAVRRNDEETIKQLVTAGYLNEVLDATGRTALLIASSRSSSQLVKSLIAQGADITATTTGGWTALHHAARYDDMRNVKYLIAAGAEIDALTKSGKSSLYLAALHDHLSITRYLIGKKASISIQSSEGSTALHAAALSSSRKILQMLLEYGADADTSDMHQWTAAHLAWASQKKSTQKLFKKFKISDSPHGIGPSCWNDDRSDDQNKKANFTLSNDRLDATTISAAGSDEEPEDSPVQLRANHPIPAGKYLYYFEVKIIALAAGDEVSIGISGRNDPENTPLLGRNQYTWAYHSRFGFKFHKAKHGFDYGAPYGVGDTIGCGVDFKTWTCFFTKNGSALPTAFRRIRGRLWPAVGVKGNSPTTFQANFSGPFMWNKDYKGPTRKIQAIRGDTVEDEDVTDDETSSEDDDDDDSNSKDSDDSDIIDDTDEDVYSMETDSSEESSDDDSDSDDSDDSDDSNDSDADDNDDANDNDNNSNDRDDNNTTTESKTERKDGDGDDVQADDKSWSTVGESGDETNVKSASQDKKDSAISTGKQTQKGSTSTSRKRIPRHQSK